MNEDRKTKQLQIRVSPSEKAAIRRAAKRSGMRMSDWVLSKVLSAGQEKFQQLVNELSEAEKPSYIIAELNEMLNALPREEFQRVVSEGPPARLTSYWENYVAAMVEHAAMRKNATVPVWIKKVQSLEEPIFGSSLDSLRLHLLTNSPPAFRGRNIFIDSSVGDRV